MKRTVIRILLPVAVLAGATAAGLLLIATGPKAQRRIPEPAVPAVETLTVAPSGYTVLAHTQGAVEPRTQSELIPEAAGRIIEVSAGFRNGGFFEEGQVLARIDQRDYENALTMAQADLAQARLALREEEAQAEQARRDWRNLGMEGDPNDLASRRPQLESASARVAAAEARLAQARIDLDRTVIRAPYAGRVLEKRADVGQYVAPGAGLATIYAVDYVEVRLPLTDRQTVFIDIPEAYRDKAPAGPGPKVTLSASSGGKTHSWPGRIVRAEGAIDTRSRQLFVVAQVDDPYARGEGGRPPLKIGQFVKAAIEGRTLQDVFVIPREAVVGEDETLVITPEDRVERRRLEVIWRDEKNVVARSGLTAGERISLTPLPFAVNGAPVKPQARGEKERRSSED